MNHQRQKHITPRPLPFSRARGLDLRIPASLDPQYLPATHQLIANNLIQKEALHQ